jgi:Sec-independent protein secretion pathway component TatC
MFYIKELVFRFQYYILSLFVVFSIAYCYRKVLFFLLTLPLIEVSGNSFKNSESAFNSLIYTHPAELFKIHFFLMLLVSLIFGLFQLFWHFADFVKTSLSVREYNKLLNSLLFLFFVVFSSNLFFYFVLFPKFWFFFQNFNFSSDTETLNFFLELKVQEYFKFVLDFLYTINIFILILYALTFLILFFGLEKFIYWKKLFIFVNIVFATLLSPPDVYSQLVILIILSVFLELLVFVNIYYYKLCNNVFNKALN